MTSAQALWGFALAVALFCAAHSPGNRRPAIEAGVVVLANWLLCMWAYAPVTPVDLIWRAARIEMDPVALWRMQDTVFCLFLAWRFYQAPHAVTAIVGGALVAQIWLHGFSEHWAAYSAALDTIFGLQLLAIGWQGGGYIGRRIRNRAARRSLLRMGSRRGRSHGSACAACEGCPIGRCVARSSQVGGG